MHAPDWKIHPDGTYDILCGALRILGAGPGLDDAPARGRAVRTTADSIEYDLAEGALALRFRRTASGFAIATVLEGLPEAPHWVFPLFHGCVDGADRFFRHGLGFAGPSGFVRLADQPDSIALESYMATALCEPGGAALAFGPTDHRNYLHKSALMRRTHRRGLGNPHVDRQAYVLEAGYAAERIPLPDGRLVLPDLHFVPGPSTWDAMRSWARLAADDMGARTEKEPRYHWCSWYDRARFLTREQLEERLDGLANSSPSPDVQTVQIDDGYMPSRGDWLEVNHRWPGGLAQAFRSIADHGYAAGVWVAPYMVGNRSRLYAEHPDWMLRDADGEIIREWQHYNGTANDEEHYVLDTSHPDAMDYIRNVFRTMRDWGATFFKTDFLDWGLKDSTTVRRHTSGKTSVQHFRDLMKVIREEIGEDSYWLGCICPFAPAVGMVDGIRVANDVGCHWSEGGLGNMLQESYADLYLNGLFWQNDPDVLYIRDYFTKLSDRETMSLALWDGMLGGSVNTSDAYHRCPPERRRLWRFLKPAATVATARAPYWDKQRPTRVLARRYEDHDAWSVLVLNPTGRRETEALPVSELVGLPEAWCYTWGPDGHQAIGRRAELVARLESHEAMLYYLAGDDTPPPEGLTLGGAMDMPQSTSASGD